MMLAFAIAPDINTINIDIGLDNHLQYLLLEQEADHTNSNIISFLEVTNVKHIPLIFFIHP